MGLLGVFIFFLLFLLFIGKNAYAFSVKTPAQIEDYLHYKSQMEGVSVSRVLSIVRCESQFNPNAIHDSEKEYSVGIFQINLKAHPYISKAQALDPIWSARWAIDKMVLGQWSMWTCDKHETL